MIIAVDTDVLVHWQMSGAVHHRAVRDFFDHQVGEKGVRLGLTAQVLHEFMHVTTDSRRFPAPMPMPAAIRRSRELWDSPDVVRLWPGAEVFHRTLALQQERGLGRKRILDTAFAATLESAGVKRIATLNGRDFEIFDFLEVVNPTV